MTDLLSGMRSNDPTGAPSVGWSHRDTLTRMDRQVATQWPAGTRLRSVPNSAAHLESGRAPPRSRSGRLGGVVFSWSCPGRQHGGFFMAP